MTEISSQKQIGQSMKEYILMKSHTAALNVTEIVGDESWDQAPYYTVHDNKKSIPYWVIYGVIYRRYILLI